jgi:hypothetical protein
MSNNRTAECSNAGNYTLLKKEAGICKTRNKEFSAAKLLFFDRFIKDVFYFLRPALIAQVCFKANVLCTCSYLIIPPIRKSSMEII